MSRPMKLAALATIAFLVGSPLRPDPPRAAVSEPQGEIPFVPSPNIFADDGACVAYLAATVKSSAPPAFEAAVGPYRIAPGDVRAHRVKAEGWGHDIEEFRCLRAALSSRRWSHAMGEVKPITMDDIRGMSFPKE